MYDSRRRTSYYDSRRRTDYYDSRRRNSYYDSRRRTDYSRRRSDYDYSRRRSYYNSGSNYGSTDSSGGGGFSPWIVVGIVFGVLALFLLIVLYLYHGGLRSLKYVVATPASDDVGPNTNRNIGPAEGAPTRYTPVLPSDPTGPVGYSTNQSPAFFSMGTGTSDPPTQASEAPQLPSQYPSSQYPPPPYPPATYLAHTDSGVQDVPTIRATITLYSGPYEPPGMQAPPLPLPPQIREELDNDDGGMPEGGYPPPVPPALPTSIVLPPSSIPPPPTVAPPVETVDEPSMHVSAPADAPPPSYNDLFKS